jgi:hypothetical protein
LAPHFLSFEQEMRQLLHFMRTVAFASRQDVGGIIRIPLKTRS